MNSASLDLCKKLYELSGWYDCHASWVEIVQWNRVFPKPLDHVVCGYVCDDDHRREIAPAYDLGYIRGKFHEASYDGSPLGERVRIVEDMKRALLSGEDAACKLAIELVKQGVLQREGLQS